MKQRQCSKWLYSLHTSKDPDFQSLRSTRRRLFFAIAFPPHRPFFCFNRVRQAGTPARRQWVRFRISVNASQFLPSAREACAVAGRLVYGLDRAHNEKDKKDGSRSPTTSKRAEEKDSTSPRSPNFPAPASLSPIRVPLHVFKKFPPSSRAEGPERNRKGAEYRLNLQLSPATV